MGMDLLDMPLVSVRSCRASVCGEGHAALRSKHAHQPPEQPPQPHGAELSVNHTPLRSRNGWECRPGIPKRCLQLTSQKAHKCVKPGKTVFVTFLGREFIIFKIKPHNSPQVCCQSNVERLMADPIRGLFFTFWNKSFRCIFMVDPETNVNLCNKHI